MGLFHPTYRTGVSSPHGPTLYPQLISTVFRYTNQTENISPLWTSTQDFAKVVRSSSFPGPPVGRLMIVLDSLIFCKHSSWYPRGCKAMMWDFLLLAVGFFDILLTFLYPPGLGTSPEKLQKPNPKLGTPGESLGSSRHFSGVNWLAKRRFGGVDTCFYCFREWWRMWLLKFLS